MNNDDNKNTITLDISGLDDMPDMESMVFADTSWGSGTDTITLQDDYSLDFSSIYNTNPGIDVNQGDIKIHHEGDIKLGDRSLKEFMSKVEERLNILQPNTELEEKWEALRVLGEQYRELEKELVSKEKVWAGLNQE